MGENEEAATSEHTLVPIETDNMSETSNKEESNAAPPSTRDGKEELVHMENLYASWSEDDFPNKSDQGRRGINKLLGFYVDARSVLLKKGPPVQDREPICCDGIVGLFGLLFLLLADIAYVAYACFYQGLDKDGDVHLLWMSAILWFVILVKIARRLVRLAHSNGGCWTVFAKMAQLYHVIVNGVVRVLTAPWRAIWNNVSGDEATIQRKKDLTMDM
ncbi:unnamed protein product [Hydatigera taeniaeformis]|uniref:DUF4220 domain-containing protein n=1 Tax=Hydatigena taeniaeformis TaxID=6205 RepID=A0A0R3WVK7_HYDTA|nr:unnamed protein product [Hydatigera taeniaeformis]